MEKKNKKMLVVDDDPSFRDLLQHFFSLRGWEVITADEAEMGIRLFRKHHPSAVILDVNLGVGRDGISLCDQIRDDISSEYTAILLVTAERRSSNDQLKGASSGADAYVFKPVQMTVLEERVTEALKVRLSM